MKKVFEDIINGPLQSAISPVEIASSAVKPSSVAPKPTIVMDDGQQVKSQEQPKVQQGSGPVVKPVVNGPVPGRDENEVKRGVQANTRIASPSELVPPVEKPSHIESKPIQPLSYAEIFMRMNPHQFQTEGDVEKERKKQKREAIFAAVGDGIASLSNLFFASKGAPNAYNPSLSLSAAYRKRYDDLKKQRETANDRWFNGYLRASAMDEENKRADRSYRHALEREKITDTRYDAQQKKDEERYKDNVTYRDKKDIKEDSRYQQQFEANEAQRKETNSMRRAEYGLSAQNQKDNKELREMQIKYTGAKGVRGKRIGFADGNGNEVGVYENVWRGSMQQVFDVLAAELKPKEMSDRIWSSNMAKMKASQKEDFVKQNWTKSPRASSIMLALSKVDPVNMVSGLEEDEDDNVPPSRRGSKENDDNTPPSRR